MKHILLLLFLPLLAIQANAKKAHKGRTKEGSNQLNLTLETAFIFEPKDAYHDISFIKSIRDFLLSLETQLTNKLTLRSEASAQKFKLNDFVYELGKYLLTYKEENLRSLLLTFQDVVEDYYPTQQFKKLFFDPRIRTFLKNTIKIWSEMEPKEIQRNLRVMFMKPTYNESFTNFLYTISNFYDSSESETLYKLVKKFEKFPTRQMKLKKNIEKCLDFIVFDKFKQLGIGERSTLVKELGHLADYVGTQFSNISTVFDDETGTNLRASEDVKLKSRKQVDDAVKETIEQLPDSERPVRPYDSFEKTLKVKEPTASSREMNDNSQPPISSLHLSGKPINTNHTLHAPIKIIFQRS